MTKERTYWGDSAAGIVFAAADTGRVLCLRRAKRTPRGKKVLDPGTWSVTVGGRVEAGEHPFKAALREAGEEVGIFVRPVIVRKLDTFRDGGFEYNSYLVVIPNEFNPNLNWENDDWAWVPDESRIPKPVHFGTEFLVKHGLFEKVATATNTARIILKNNDHSK